MTFHFTYFRKYSYGTTSLNQRIRPKLNDFLNSWPPPIVWLMKDNKSLFTYSEGIFGRTGLLACEIGQNMANSGYTLFIPSAISLCAS